MLRTALVLSMSVALVAACDSSNKPADGAAADGKLAQRDGKADPTPDGKPEPTPEPEPAPEPAAKIAIASVTIVEDCPDDKSLPWRPPAERPVDEAERELAAKAASPPADEEMAMGAAAGDSAVPFEQPCTQSAMQIAFRDVGSAAPVKIMAVRMLRPDTKDVLATLTPREPAVWNTAGRYETWNEQLAASEKPVNTSYKLSVPSWSDVESKLGKPSMGHMFVLEVDVSVGGETQTVRSTEFTREEPEVIVT